MDLKVKLTWVPILAPSSPRYTICKKLAKSPKPGFLFCHVDPSCRVWWGWLDKTHVKSLTWELGAAVCWVLAHPVLSSELVWWLRLCSGNRGGLQTLPHTPVYPRTPRTLPWTGTDRHLKHRVSKSFPPRLAGYVGKPAGEARPWGSQLGKVRERCGPRHQRVSCPLPLPSLAPLEGHFQQIHTPHLSCGFSYPNRRAFCDYFEETALCK